MGFADIPPGSGGENLVDQVVVNGAGDHLEIWNSESWSAYNDENLENFDAYSEEVGAKYGLRARACAA